VRLAFERRAFVKTSMKMNLSTISLVVKIAVRILAVAGAASFIPSSAWACAACAVGDPKIAATYFGMTVIMSALPLCLIGGIGYWLYRHHS
jgi:hypothetical protein